MENEMESKVDKYETAKEVLLKRVFQNGKERQNTLRTYVSGCTVTENFNKKGVIKKIEQLFLHDPITFFKKYILITTAIHTPLLFDAEASHPTTDDSSTVFTMTTGSSPSSGDKDMEQKRRSYVIYESILKDKKVDAFQISIPVAKNDCPSFHQRGLKLPCKLTLQMFFRCTLQQQQEVLDFFQSKFKSGKTVELFEAVPNGLYAQTYEKPLPFSRLLFIGFCEAVSKEIKDKDEDISMDVFEAKTTRSSSSKDNTKEVKKNTYLDKNAEHKSNHNGSQNNSIASLIEFILSTGYSGKQPAFSELTKRLAACEKINTKLCFKVMNTEFTPVASMSQQPDIVATSGDVVRKSTGVDVRDLVLQYLTMKPKRNGENTTDPTKQMNDLLHLQSTFDFDTCFYGYYASVKFPASATNNEHDLSIDAMEQIIHSTFQGEGEIIEVLFLSYNTFVIVSFTEIDTAVECVAGLNAIALSANGVVLSAQLAGYGDACAPGDDCYSKAIFVVPSQPSLSTSTSSLLSKVDLQMTTPIELLFLHGNVRGIFSSQSMKEMLRNRSLLQQIVYLLKVIDAANQLDFSKGDHPEDQEHYRTILVGSHSTTDLNSIAGGCNNNNSNKLFSSTGVDETIERLYQETEQLQAAKIALKRLHSYQQEHEITLSTKHKLNQSRTKNVKRTARELEALYLYYQKHEKVKAEQAAAKALFDPHVPGAGYGYTIKGAYDEEILKYHSGMSVSARIARAKGSQLFADYEPPSEEDKFSWERPEILQTVIGMEMAERKKLQEMLPPGGRGQQSRTRRLKTQSRSLRFGTVMAADVHSKTNKKHLVSQRVWKSIELHASTYCRTLLGPIGQEGGIHKQRPTLRWNNWRYMGGTSEVDETNLNSLPINQHQDLKGDLLVAFTAENGFEGADIQGYKYMPSGLRAIHAVDSHPSVETLGTCALSNERVHCTIKADELADCSHRHATELRTRIMGGELRHIGSGYAHSKTQYEGHACALIATHHKQVDGTPLSGRQRRALIAVGDVWLNSFMTYNFPLVIEGKKPIFEFRYEKEVSSTRNWYYLKHVDITTDNSGTPYGTTNNECENSGKTGWSKATDEWVFKNK